ncbi:MAG TPA: hypothetical protein VF638_14320 [Sphingomonas sp.]|jgi:hypothetical protein
MTTDTNEKTAAETALEIAEFALSGLEASAGAVGRPFSVWESPADYERTVAEATARRDAARAEVDAEHANRLT